MASVIQPVQYRELLHENNEVFTINVTEETKHQHEKWRSLTHKNTKLRQRSTHVPKGALYNNSSKIPLFASSR